jgi:curved DNA-binding protein CbpA
MFKYYYKILGIPQSASHKEVREAYLKLSKLWHPDINKDNDATAIMQNINEAYLILKDSDKRQRYDAEHNRYHAFKQQQPSTSYDIQDDNLRKDMEDAQSQAEKYIEALLSSMKKSAKAAAKGTWDGMWPYLLWGIIGTIIALIVFSSY